MTRKLLLKETQKIIVTSGYVIDNDEKNNQRAANCSQSSDVACSMLKSLK